MGSTVTLWNVVGKAQHVFVVATVPLHRDLDAYRGGLIALPLSCGVKGIGVQHLLAFVDEINKALDPTGARKIVFLAAALVLEPDLHAVIEKAQLAQTLAQNLVVKVVVFLEDFGVR
jgi:hypothetical protein